MHFRKITLAAGRGLLLDARTGVGRFVQAGGNSLDEAYPRGDGEEIHVESCFATFVEETGRVISYKASEVN